MRLNCQGSCERVGELEAKTRKMKREMQGVLTRIPVSLGFTGLSQKYSFLAPSTFHRSTTMQLNL